MRFASTFARVATSAALLAVLAACGSSSGASSATQQPQTVSGVQTPSQISVVTAK
jgi:hypothetical protein